MLLRQIKYFVTVVDTGSFTEAAEECFISQSAISADIVAGKRTGGTAFGAQHTPLYADGTRKIPVQPRQKTAWRNGKT